MFSLVRVIRHAMGENMTEFAQHIGITQPDLHEMETSEKPYGIIEKYCKVSRYTGISVDAILRNDFTQIPGELISRLPILTYTNVPNTAEAQVGRAGEDLIFAREQERVAGLYPNLAHLVIPYYKLGIKSPGFDILSYDDLGVPFALEVKTSIVDIGTIRVTNNEHRSAQRITASGGRYQVTIITNFGTTRESITDLGWAELHREYDKSTTSYRFHKKNSASLIRGLAYHRRRAGLSQTELADLMGTTPTRISLAENNNSDLIATAYLKASNILGVPVDDLMRSYPLDAMDKEDAAAPELILEVDDEQT